MHRNVEKMINKIFPLTEKNQFALISGISFSNRFDLQKNNLCPFFNIGKEEAYLWNAKDQPSLNYLIVKIDKSITKVNIWKTLSSIIEFTLSNHSWFEYGNECDYHWIKNFDPKLTTKQLEFIEDSIEESEGYGLYSSRFSGTVKEIDFIRNYAPFIELLFRDETFYVMWMNLYSAFKNHYFCLICAYEKEGYRMHPNHEIPIWQRSQAIPAMEIGILQSTRAVESALGKPGKKEVKRKYERVLDRWKNTVDIDPNSKFFLADKSYIDYYYELFDIRGAAAHSLGSFPYELRRKNAIKAQGFAFEIMRRLVSCQVV